MKDQAPVSSSKTAARGPLADWRDRELLQAYAGTGAQDALGQVIRRYSPLVYGVCLRLLGEPQAAEDASQVTFLVFSRKAAGLVGVRSLPGWLFQTARRVALDARRELALRRRHEEAAARARRPGEADMGDCKAVQAELDEALGELSPKLREAVVLRHLTGLTEQEAAQELGCPVGTVSARVARGLEKLREILAQRGFLLSAPLLAGFLAEAQAVEVPAGLVLRTLAVCTGHVAAPAATLAAVKGMEAAMFWLQVKWVAAVVLCTALAAGGVTIGLKAAEAARATAAGSAASVPPPAPRAEATAVAPGPLPGPVAGPPESPDAKGAAQDAHDWPCYAGPLGTFADQTKTPLLDDFSKARLVWKSEDKSIGWGKTTSGESNLTKRAPGLYPSGQGSLIVAGGLVIAGYFIPSGEAIAKEAEGVAPECRQRALIGADDVILAVDAATGKTKWKQVFAGKGINRGAGKRPSYGPTPAAADGRVFHLGTTGRIYCVELATGKPLWESSGGPKDILTSLVVCDQVLLVPSGGTLLGFDVATGKNLWEVVNALSGHNVASPVKVEGQQTLFCINGQGEMRLIEPKTGKVLWMQAATPKIAHFTQPVAADGKAFVWNPGATVPGSKGRTEVLGKPACYTLRLDGAKLLWELPDEYKHGMGGDGGPCAKMGYRDGVAYFGAFDFNPGGKIVFVAVNAADGKLLHRLTPTGGFGQFHLWGDKFVLIGDNSHESMGWGCEYTPFTLELKPTGKSYSPRGNQGVSGYVHPIRDPFADGLQFTRTATGQIWCYDLRKTGDTSTVPTVEPKGK